MYQTKDYETVNVILRNSNLWNNSMIDETLRRFKDIDTHEDRAFYRRNVQELVKNFLHTLFDVMEKEGHGEKIKNDVRSLSDFTLPEWVR
ncbi:MAG TPA: hypothetical protein VMT12_11150 [Syntrophales bacterium]|nr:hypothetical protein [Syntrophales bacterium]